jgi:NAD(P)-dependent dehydrogenase (short-subunit alcohol dehydrogenase family)
MGTGLAAVTRTTGLFVSRNAHYSIPSIAKPIEGHTIVNTASMAGLNSGLGFSPYSASKSGVVNISEGLARQLKPLGIGVNASRGRRVCREGISSRRY